MSDFIKTLIKELSSSIEGLQFKIKEINLNTNNLRNIKNYLVGRLSLKEKSCLNIYNLENFLIEKTLNSYKIESINGMFKKDSSHYFTV